MGGVTVGLGFAASLFQLQGNGITTPAQGLSQLGIRFHRIEGSFQCRSRGPQSDFIRLPLRLCGRDFIPDPVGIGFNLLGLDLFRTELCPGFTK